MWSYHEKHSVVDSQAVLMLPQNQLLIFGGRGEREATHFGLDKILVSGKVSSDTNPQIITCYYSHIIWLTNVLIGRKLGTLGSFCNVT